MGKKQNIRKLEAEIIKRYFDYRLVQRNDSAAIYGQYDKRGVLVAYEVIRIKLSPPHFATKSQYDLIELYPGEKQFGVNGWSFPTFGELRTQQALQKAHTKFQQL